MGIWDQLRSVAGRVSGRRITSDSTISGGAYDSDFAITVTKAGDAVSPNWSQRLEDYGSLPQRPEKIGQILNHLTKLAVSSAFEESLKDVPGVVQVSKGVKERSQDRPSQSAHDKKLRSLPIMVEEMQAKMEKTQEEMNNTTQPKLSTHCEKAPDHHLQELLAEPSNESASPKPDTRKVFIRSRL